MRESIVAACAPTAFIVFAATGVSNAHANDGPIVTTLH